MKLSSSARMAASKAKAATRQAVSKLADERGQKRNARSGVERCPACGRYESPVYAPAMWPELIEQWGLSPQWAQWFDEREGRRCPHCGSNLRARQLAQTIVATLNHRCDLEAKCLRELCEDKRVQALSFAEINSAGSLHPFLAKLPLLKYSEFGSQDPAVPAEDLMNLSYRDATFDYAITSETLEHVPDVDRALQEIHRVLKPGGIHVFTVPMVESQAQTRQRASLHEGQLICHLPKSYHGAPAEGKDDYLVFSEFGADFIARVQSAGFDTELVRDEENLALIVFVARRK